ncbi:hypothetical protein PCASD_14125 [Puccinia coronata f. sp. avenae]|uniref:Uncharacterized protein n=1 Tax=Puccinia coronata f. sp. avenae TaxID=200324 RepID=A0A2N5UFY9_9BASI|nr:hypothetical protein PCASD_14125 [Puccinia coronata f. sp. avenae]
MKVTGFTIIIVLFNVLAHHLASITEHTTTRINEVDWTDKMPSLPGNKCSISSGPFQAQKGYHKAVGTDRNPIYLSNGEKDHPIRVLARPALHAFPGVTAFGYSSCAASSSPQSNPSAGTSSSARFSRGYGVWLLELRRILL